MYKTVLFLRSELQQHNYNYYVLDKPTISDFEFDMLLNELIDLEKQNPQYYDANSPTQRVGGELLNHLIQLLTNTVCYL